MSEKFSFEQALLQELSGIRQALEAIAKLASEPAKARPRFTAPPKWLSDEIVEELLAAGGQKEFDRLEAAKKHMRHLTPSNIIGALCAIPGVTVVGTTVEIQE